MSDHSSAIPCARRAAFALIAFALLLAAACDSVTEPVERISENPAVPAGRATVSMAGVPNPVIQVSAGDYHTCALLADGVIECWGRGPSSTPPPSRWTTPSGFVQLATGNQTCAVDGDGLLHCVKDGVTTTRAALAGAFTAVSIGSSHSCALRDDGRVECTGENTNGRAPPLKSAMVGTFVQVSAGYWHTCALRDDGRMECWGGYGGEEAAPLRSAATGRFVQVSTDFLTTCALRDDGAVQCWGANPFGAAPSLHTATVGRFTEIANAGRYHSCGLRDDGAIECWGSNPYGAAPRLVTASSGVYTQISTSNSEHSCALRSDGVARCWGQDNLGQLYPVPEKPAGVEAAVVGARIRLSWENPPWQSHWGDLFRYRIQRRIWSEATGAWGEWEAERTLTGASTEWNDADLTPGGRYSYRIKVCNPHVCSDAVKTATVIARVPVAPTGFGAGLTGAGSVELTWAAGDALAASFRIQRRDRLAGGAWGAWTAMANVPNSATGWSNGVIPSGRYQYRIRACNAIGCSAFAVSGALSVLPAAPSSLTATVAGALVNLAWLDMSDGETAFELQRRDWNTAGSAWDPWTGLSVSPANATASSDATVAASGRYHYRVRACSPWGCSAWLPAVNTVTMPAG